MTKTDFDKNNSPVQFLREFGPGIVTGAADDDPSGVATYTIAGAQFGYGLLWTAWLTWPLMASVQMMCAHISLASRKSLTNALMLRFPRRIVFVIVFALFLANVLNAAADLSAMADALEVLTGHNSFYYVIAIGVILIAAMIFLTYRTIARILTWMTFFLIAYVFTAMKVNTDWSQLAKGTLGFQWPKSSTEWATIVAILGTTISPYLFFWQSSQEVEEIATSPNFNFEKTKIFRRWDVLIGTFVSNLVMYFIIWTAAGSLHHAGITNIESSKQAALALEPLLGSSALLVYTIGILGVGALAIPTLVGSASFAVADVLKWNSGLGKKWSQARAFYIFLCFSMICAIAIDFIKLNPIKTLFYSSIVNGLLSPVLILACLLVIKDVKIIGDRPINKLGFIMVSLTAGVMIFAAIGMFVFT